ncbi:MAG: sugar ABC transporter permease [Caldilineaceae bacterium]|nr:sugar ABC transporter permease [Caldilineaceae bacterium]MCB9159938.1 sugar ABC transporter permease [Caldilineaceae bacterium]
MAVTTNQNLDGKQGAPRRRRLRTRDLGYYLFLAPAFAFICFTMIYPVFSNLRMSVYGVNVATFLSNTAPFVGLSNYTKVLQDPTFQNAFMLSVLFTIGSLVFQFTIGFALAVLFNRSFPGNGLLRALMLLGWMLPTVVSGSIYRWMFDGDNGIINYLLQSVGLMDSARFWLIEPRTALIGTIVANIWVGIPFNMILLLPGLQSISHTLYEAASIDGATGWQSFRRITLPLMRPVALSVLLLGFIYTFKVFDIVYVMTRGGPVNATTVLPIYVYLLSFNFFRFGDGAAAAVLLLLPLSVVAIGYLWLSQREEAAS